MKKIISALVLGATAVGFATADLKIAANYRNGANMFEYWNNRATSRKHGLDEEKENTKTFFDLMDWNGGADSVDLRANGNIFSFRAQVNPTVDSDNGGFSFKVLTVGAKVGNFTFESGFQADGVMGYRVKKDADAENAEGKVFETYKLGSTLSANTTSWTGAVVPSRLSENQVSFTGSGNNYYAQAGYKFGFGERVSLGLKVAAISNHAWGKASSLDTSTDVTKDTAASAKDNSNVTEKRHNWNTRYLGWSVFLEPEFKGILGAELFAKGQRQDKKNYAHVLGGYAKLLFLPDSAIGGAVGLWNGHVNEWSTDLRLYLKLGDRVTFTTMNNFTKLLRNNGKKVTSTQKKETPLGSASGIGGLGGFKSSTLLWDMVSLRFKLNDTLAIIGTVGQQTDFDSGYADDGTQLYVYPHVQIFAASNASFTAGVVTAFGGLGAHKDRNPKFDVLVSVPLLVRIKM